LGEDRCLLDIPDYWFCDWPSKAYSDKWTLACTMYECPRLVAYRRGHECASDQRSAEGGTAVIDGEITSEIVFPEAGMSGWCWTVTVQRPDGRVEKWAPLKAYATAETARDVLACWRKSRRMLGMLQMGLLPGRDA
jgi:hypothetical protein